MEIGNFLHNEDFFDIPLRAYLREYSNVNISALVEENGEISCLHNHIFRNLGKTNYITTNVIINYKTLTIRH